MVDITSQVLRASSLRSLSDVIFGSRKSRCSHPLALAVKCTFQLCLSQTFASSPGKRPNYDDHPSQSFQCWSSDLPRSIHSSEAVTFTRQPCDVSASTHSAPSHSASSQATHITNILVPRVYLNCSDGTVSPSFQAVHMATAKRTPSCQR